MFGVDFFVFGVKCSVSGVPIQRTDPKLQNFAEIYTHVWDAKSRETATLFLVVLKDFEFIEGIVTLYRLLHSIVQITQKL